MYKYNQLNMKNYKGYNKLPYCNVKVPPGKHEELQRLQQTSILQCESTTR